MLNIINNSRNANQNYNETPSHTGQNGYHEKLPINAGEGVGKRQPSYTVDGNVNWCGHYGKQYGSSSEK